MSVFRCPFLTFTTSISALAYLLIYRGRSLFGFKPVLKAKTSKLIGAIETGGTFTTLAIVKVSANVYI